VYWRLFQYLGLNFFVYFKLIFLIVLASGVKPCLSISQVSKFVENNSSNRSSNEECLTGIIQLSYGYRVSVLETSPGF
jgi:hypothetical protein